MKKANPIVGMTLEGFQVFDKATYIPLDGLTLLFGPNSAGKSAIQDAIELYSKLIRSGVSKPSLFDTFSDSDVVKLLERHWRRTGADNSWANKLGISIRHTTPCLVDQAVAYNLGRTLIDDPDFECPNDLELESRWSFTRLNNDEEEGGLSFTWDFEFLIQSELLVSSVGNELLVNLGHPVLRSIEKTVNYFEVAKVHPKEVSFDGKIIQLHKCVTGFQPSGLDFHSKNSHWLSYLTIFDNHSDLASHQEKPLIYAAIGELSLLVGCVLEMSQGNSSFQPFKIDASRTVPTSQDLTFQLGEWDDLMQLSAIRPSTRYTTLADSLTSNLINPDSTYPSLAERRRYSDDVNHALAGSLFIDQGYRLDYDFRILLSQSNSQAAIDGLELNRNEFGYLVEIFLRDSQGRKHLFEDVGSGIGYLLPVLCGIFENSHKFSTCFVQQPELHIHPALQAAMGDVLIGSNKGGPQLLIETHSEHLLLRILKRIRQTHLQTHIASELKINADDVCVLYFDPSPNGTTAVKHLRITEDGEFMDRWPRGFFNERDQELFDE